MHVMMGMPGMLAAASLLVLPLVGQAAQRGDNPDAEKARARAEETIAAYAKAWNEPDVSARRALLEKAWAPTGVYTDPTAHVEGRDALVQHISGFISAMPGATIVPTSGVDLHHRQVRFSWRLVKADGSVATEGMDFGTLDAEGRLERIVGFFGPFPAHKR